MDTGLFVLFYPGEERESVGANQVYSYVQADSSGGRGSVSISGSGQRSLVDTFGPCRLGLCCTGTASSWDLQSVLSWGGEGFSGSAWGVLVGSFQRYWWRS